MADTKSAPPPDFREGFALQSLPDGGQVLGRVDTEDAILVRRGDQLFAVGAHCTHYHGPLAEGLVVGDTVRCPWHHACFSLKTGEALRAPALDPIPCWRVERVGDMAYVREKQAASAAETARPSSTSRSSPTSIVIVGGGGAGLAAADMLRRRGYAGALTMLSADDSAPPDRPNLSKDFLAGTAKDDWIPLRPPEFYAEQRIELVLNARAASLDAQGKHLRLENGKHVRVRRAAARHRRRARAAATSRARPIRRCTTCGRSPTARRSSPGPRRRSHVVVVGASFIGLEVAASLRARGIEVTLSRPTASRWNASWARKLGGFIRRLHEEHGVVFHLGPDRRSRRAAGA